MTELITETQRTDMKNFIEKIAHTSRDDFTPVDDAMYREYDVVDGVTIVFDWSLGDAELGSIIVDTSERDDYNGPEQFINDCGAVYDTLDAELTTICTSYVTAPTFDEHNSTDTQHIYQFHVDPQPADQPLHHTH